MQLQYLAFWRVPSESIFSFTGWRIYLYSSGLKAQVLLVQDSFCFFTWSLARDSTHLFTAASLFKTDILPISADERGGYFRFRILANHLASFSPPVRWFVRTTICPYTSFFIHPVTECKHLLASILTWICYFGCEGLAYITIPLFSSQPLAAC